MPKEELLIHTVHNVLNYSRSPPAMLVDC
jgi:hypothetical protein